MTSIKSQLIFLWNYVEWGGAQIYMLAIMKEAKADFDIVVILPRDSMPDILYFLDRLEIRHEFFDISVDGGTAPTLKHKLKRQWRRIRSEVASFRSLNKYDLSRSILHIEAAPWQSWILITALAMRRANVFVTMHNFMPRPSRLREFIWKCRLQFISRLPRFHIFPSNQDTKNKLKGWVANKFWDEMKVTTTAVDPVEIAEAVSSTIDKASMRTQHGLDGDKFLILCVGQFVDRKGRWVFLEAAKLALESDSNIAFVWLTPQMPEAGDLAKIDEYRLENAFRLVLSSDVGQSRNEVLAFFRVADAFALASFVEGLPIALLEAMALGLPSISTNVNAIPEAVKHLDTGILIEAGDAAALSEAFLTLKSSEMLRERLSTKGRNYVLTNFDETKVAHIAISSYKDALKGK